MTSNTFRIIGTIGDLGSPRLSTSTIRDLSVKRVGEFKAGGFDAAERLARSQEIGNFHRYDATRAEIVDRRCAT